MKKRLMILVALLFVCFGTYQATMALFREETAVQSPISAGTLGIDIVNDSFEKKGEYTFGNIMPNSTIENNVQLKNTKDKDLYVRVIVERYWNDQAGNKVVEADASLITILSENAKDWILLDDKENSNNEILYYYYKLPLSSNEITSSFMEAVHFDASMSDQTYSKYQGFIKVDVEAIQMVGAKDAILSQWGMNARFDEQGTLVEITE